MYAYYDIFHPFSVEVIGVGRLCVCFVIGTVIILLIVDFLIYSTAVLEVGILLAGIIFLLESITAMIVLNTFIEGDSLHLDLHLYFDTRFHLFLVRFCNQRFDIMYFSTRPGVDEFHSWRHVWASNSQVDPQLRVFLADQYLPYWLQCNTIGCGKWKQIAMKGPISKEYIAKFICGMKSDGTVVGVTLVL